MPASFRLRTLALALPLLLAACATTTQPEPPRSTRGATDDLGLIADLALSLAERHGARFEPAAILRTHAESGEMFR